MKTGKRKQFHAVNGEASRSTVSQTLFSNNKKKQQKLSVEVTKKRKLGAHDLHSTKPTKTAQGHRQKKSCGKPFIKSGERKSRNSEIWFDGVPPALIAASREDQVATSKSLVKASSFSGPTRRIALDCEFVGVGYEGKENALARVSIVNQFGHVLLDTLVRPNERVTDYRTQYSGIRPGDLRPDGPARPFRAVHREVAKLCKGRILIGHSIRNDLKVLMLSHPRRQIRDTSRYRPFRALFSGRTPSLRALTDKVLGVQVQVGEHDSVEDARAAMRLYNSVKRIWESKKKGPLPPVRIAAEPNRTSNDSGSQPDTIATKMDILSEYESGLDPVVSSDATTKQPIPPSGRRPSSGLKSKPWDNTRNRRCSKNREKFLQKRRGRSRAPRRTGFQSAAL